MNQNKCYREESENRYNSEITKIGDFFEQIWYIFRSAYNRIILEKNAKQSAF